MKRIGTHLLAGVAVVFAISGVLCGSENMVSNGGFEDVSETLVFKSGNRGGAGDQWTVRLLGDWVGKADQSKVVAFTTDAHTGKRALMIDTTVLNPSGQITDEMRYWRKLKYQIYVTRRIEGIEPGAWYLAKFRIKSPGMAIDEGLEYLADLVPWTLQTFGKDAKLRPHWKSIHAWERRLFLPQSPIADGEYHEYVLLKQAYPGNDAIEVGLRIRAPWTGKIILDDVELYKIDPDKDMTAMEKFLAMRATRPLTEVRPLNRETTLVEAGKPVAAILAGEGGESKTHAETIQAKVAQLTGAKLPIAMKLADVPKGAAIVALGSVVNNDLVARLHFNRYVHVDALAPGPGGYVLWTVAEPYGLEKKQNVIVVGGSDAAGQDAAVKDFCEMLSASNKTIRLELLHKVYPTKTIPDDKKQVPRNQWGLKWNRNRLSGFANYYLSHWLRTGDLEVARLARDELLKVAEAYLENPYFQTAWCSYQVGWAWDAMEELPGFSDADRLKISNALLGYLHMRPQAGTSGWSRLIPRLIKDEPTWNHQAKGLAGAYTMARYFQRFYGETDGRYQNYLAAASNCFREQGKYSKPQENSANYWLITMRFMTAWFLGEWDKTFFDNGAMRRYAEYFPMVCDNRGGLSGFGDAYYCYTGWKGMVGTRGWQVPLAFWYYKDPRMLWWMQHVSPEWKNAYHQDVEPVEWTELLGVKKIPIDSALYVPKGKTVQWNAGGGSGANDAGEVSLEEAFDKITFRDSWSPTGQYMSLEGLGRGIHSGYGTNQICKLFLGGEDLLIGSTYKKNNVRTNCSVVVVKDADIDDPKVKGKGKYPYQWYRPLSNKYRGYAAVKTLADLPTFGMTQTAIPGHLGNTDWYRNVFWVKGKFFALIDEVVARDAGEYYIESNFSTCPRPRKGNYPALTPCTWKLTDEDKVFEVTYERPDGLKQYIVSDGRPGLAIDPYVYKAEHIDKTIVRQVAEGVKLDAGSSATVMTLMYGDVDGGRKDYRIERIGPQEAIVFEGQKPIAWFGIGQGERSKSILPIEARMFVLADGKLAVVDGKTAGTHLTSDQSVTLEVELGVEVAAGILERVAKLVKE